MAKVPKHIQKYHITQKIEQSNYAIIYKVYPVRESDLNHVRDKTRSRLRRGEVFSNGVNDPDGKPVVLKIAHEKKDEYNELISREFQILAQFKHPNIVPVFDYDITDDGRAYFILEYITGKSINKCFKDFLSNLLTYH